jgi:hypothetical protein
MRTTRIFAALIMAGIVAPSWLRLRRPDVLAPRA